MPQTTPTHKHLKSLLIKTLSRSHPIKPHPYNHSSNHAHSNHTYSDTPLTTTKQKIIKPHITQITPTQDTPTQRCLTTPTRTLIRPHPFITTQTTPMQNAKYKVMGTWELLLCLQAHDEDQSHSNVSGRANNGIFNCHKVVFVLWFV